MKKAVILLAEGFEEGESLLTIDILRRAGITCISSSIKDREVKGCNGIVAVADTLFQNIHLDEYDMLILPGGMPGAQNLADDDRVIDAVEAYINGYADVKHTLRQLVYHKPNYQVCILSQEIVDKYLQFKSYERV